MKRLMYILAVLCLLLAACERRPLEDISNTHYVKVYVDENLKNVTEGFYNDSYARPSYKAPAVMRVALYDPHTGRVAAERYLRHTGVDEKGRWYDGYIIAEPGDYRLLVYNFDTEATIISAPGHYMEAKAYTNEIASHLRSRIPSRADSDEKIVYEPDHLFTARYEGVHVPYVDYVDTLKTSEGEPYFRGESIVQSYYLQLKVKGMQYVSSAMALLTGMSGYKWLHNGLMDETAPVTVYFDMSRTDEAAQDEDGAVVAYTTFNTFGKIPGISSDLSVTFDFLTVYGTSVSRTIDISLKFGESDAVEHQWLLLDETIEIPEPPDGGGGGGFSPDIGEWGDENSDIII